VVQHASRSNWRRDVLGRLTSMADRPSSERFLAFIEAELNQERAALLGRFGRRVEKAIAVCEAQLAHLDPTDQRALDAYRSARAEALRAIDDLCLQREMVGLTDHSGIDRFYPVPPPR
jgi:hypothetical protein